MANDPVAYQHAARQDAHTARNEARPQTQSSPEAPSLSLGKVTAINATTYTVLPIAVNGYAGGTPIEQVPVIPRGSSYAVDDIVWLAKLGDMHVILAAGGGGSTCAMAVDVFGVFNG